MPQALEINVDQLMEQVRASRTTGVSEAPSPPGKASSPATEEPADLAYLQNNYDVYHIDFTSHRRIMGRVVVLIKQVLRQFMTPILERQCFFNAASARLASHMQQEISHLQQQLEAARERQATALQAVRQEVEAWVRQQQSHAQQHDTYLQQQLEAARERQATALQAVRSELTDEMHALGQEVKRGLAEGDTQQRGLGQQLARYEKVLSRLKLDHILQERRLTVLLEEARKRLPEPMNQQQLEVFASESRHMLDALYVSFEDQFRGTREDIKERFRVYLPILKQAMRGSDDMAILDIGCGRGEWLDLLNEEGLQAQGVDLNRVLVAECRSRGLQAIEAEAISHLSTLPPNSLGAVTGFHIIEHLAFDTLVALLDETVRVLKPGGVAIFETPNPENVLVGSCNFYFDPSHRNPLPSPMIKFIAEARGLCRVEILNLHPYPESYRVEGGGLDVAQRFNEYFYGPQDYAVVGWKV
jgi:2-polyprenyl-3-methyl-5-hydroxy-6-metoxy-1,4-benzoquinol methylase